MSSSAVLLMAFGAPSSIHEVPAFILRLTGRVPAAPVLERVVARYQAIGGGSPMPRLVREKAAALARYFEANGVPVAVRAAFRYSDPSIDQAVRLLAESGYRRVIGISDSPHFSRVSTGAYMNEFREAAERYNVRAVQADTYFAAPRFVQAIADQIRAAREGLRSPGDTFLLFSAHSLPLAHIAQGDQYVDELKATVDGVVAALGVHDWKIAYQSRGFGEGEWLEPAVETVLEELAAARRAEVLLVPVGFTTEHVETLYDIDVVIAAKARQLGLSFKRTPALNASEALVETLATAARPYLELG